MTSKSILVAASVLVAFLVLVTLRDREPSPVPDVSGSSRALVSLEVESSAAADVGEPRMPAPRPDEGRSAVDASREVAAPLPTSFQSRVRYERDQTPAVGVGVYTRDTPLGPVRFL